MLHFHENLHPSYAKTTFLASYEAWKQVILWFPNQFKIETFLRPVLKRGLNDFQFQNKGFGVPRRRPNLNKNRFREASLEVSKNVSMKRSSEESEDQGQRPRQGGWGAYLILRIK